ncbi:MAG TPA: dihydrofolate reductase family protein [Burkholderiales bacterium]|nr:dihydrofolate reductase family protein [Burkholderiales bacterium]
MSKVIELYPATGRERAIEGLYLAQRIDQLGSSASPFVYANFVVSLDGRIGFVDPATGRDSLPEALTSRHDFRLFLELEAQADCLITHGGYLRAIAEGRLDNVLHIGGNETTRDLGAWRLEQGLPAQPAIAVASASLDFKVPESIQGHGQQLFIATTGAADRARISAFERAGHPVLIAGAGRWVQGKPLVDVLAQQGFHRLYLVAGPLMLAAMLRDRLLSRLYLTLTHQILGGEAFHTLFRGPELTPPQRLRLNSLYLDIASPPNGGQWFAQFECA